MGAGIDAQRDWLAGWHMCVHTGAAGPVMFLSLSEVALTAHKLLLPGAESDLRGFFFETDETVPVLL